MRLAAVLLPALLLAPPALAQSSAGNLLRGAATPSTPVPTTLAPGALDRAAARSERDLALSSARQAADRAAAQNAARDLENRLGPVAGSTLTDGPSGLGAGSATSGTAVQPNPDGR